MESDEFKFFLGLIEIAIVNKNYDQLLRLIQEFKEKPD